MLLPEIKKALYEAIGDLGEGFKGGLAQFTYLRKGTPLNHFFRVRPLKYPTYIMVTVEVHFGCPRINLLYNSFLKHQIPAQAITAGFGIWNEHRGRGSYDIEQESEVPAVAAKVLDDFREIAMPFFEQLRTLEDAARYLNGRRAQGRYAPLSVPGACLGLIAAHLVGDPEIETIYRDYHHFAVIGQGQELAQPIVQVMNCMRGDNIAADHPIKAWPPKRPPGE